MPVEVRVGPQVLTINHGSTVMITDLSGEIAPRGEQGVFAHDTRFGSSDRILANGSPWLLLSSGTPTHYLARIQLVNPPFNTEDAAVAGGTLALTISRAVAEGIHEDLDVTNFGMQSVRFNLEVALRSDFADLFEVKAHDFVRRGRITTELLENGTVVRTRYTNRDFGRELVCRYVNSGSLPVYANGRASFEVELQPGGTWHTCTEYHLGVGERAYAPARSCANGFAHGLFDEIQRQWMEQATRLTSGNEDLYRLYRQSVEDMGALRLYRPDLGADAWVPAAGVPWFVTLFGRDSLIAAMQNMLVNPGFARGALNALAQLQAREM